jgi:hypothetical protein
VAGRPGAVARVCGDAPEYRVARRQGGRQQRPGYRTWGGHPAATVAARARSAVDCGVPAPVDQQVEGGLGGDRGYPGPHAGQVHQPVDSPGRVQAGDPHVRAVVGVLGGVDPVRRQPRGGDREVSVLPREGGFQPLPAVHHGVADAQVGVGALPGRAHPLVEHDGGDRHALQPGAHQVDALLVAPARAPLVRRVEQHLAAADAVGVLLDRPQAGGGGQPRQRHPGLTCHARSVPFRDDAFRAGSGVRRRGDAGPPIRLARRAGEYGGHGGNPGTAARPCPRCVGCAVSPGSGQGPCGCAVEGNVCAATARRSGGLSCRRC